MTQYTRILDHLRRAGSKGATVRELMKYSNYPWKRLSELEDRQWWDFHSGRSQEHVHSGQVSKTEWLDRQWREVNGRKLRVYVLRRL